MWALALAAATEISVNGVTLDSRDLANRVIPSAEVRIDAQGRVSVIAPGFTVADPTRPAEAAPRPPATPAVAAPAPEPARATPEQPVWSTPGVSTSGGARAASGVAYDQWWLVLAPQRAVGHDMEVRVNGALVASHREGDAGRLLDLADVLRPGANDLQVVVRRSPSTGVVELFAGTGRLAGAAVAMTGPQVSLSIVPGGTMSRELVLHVAR